jgi:hypothetical protein
MKFATISKNFTLGLALLAASSAFAGTKANLEINNPVTVNGTTLKAGDYKITWDGTGPNVEVSILQGKTVVAKVPARLVDLKAPSSSDAAVVKTADDGKLSLSEVRFGGKKYVLQLGDTAESMQASGK